MAKGRISANSTDAVNGSQLHAVNKRIDNLANAVNEVDQRASAGIASAMASAGLPQAYLPGKSMLAASASSYRGESALALGASTISDDGKWILKGTANFNKDDAGITVGVGYQW